MKTGLVSIITPCYNASPFILQTIVSVQQQTYTNWELIIVDDNSQDHSVAIIRKAQKKDSGIHLICLSENKGAGICRNEGIKKATGEFIAFLDADDLWKPEKLARQLQFMKKKNCAVSFTSYEQVDEVGNPLNKLIVAKPEVTIKNMLLRNYIGNLTGMYHVEKLGKIYMPDWRKRQDWALWFFLYKKQESPVVCKKIWRFTV